MELKSYREHFEYRLQMFTHQMEQIQKDEGSMENFGRSFNQFGLHADATQTTYREWAPCAKEIYLFGEFNQWNKQQYALEKRDNGLWEVAFPHRHNQPKENSQ